MNNLCTTNADCKSGYNQESDPSYCLPSDYGLVTEIGGDWLCSVTQNNNNGDSNPPVDDWNSDIYYDTQGWAPPDRLATCTTDEGIPFAWGDSDDPSYWPHKVPGAESIWLGDNGFGYTIFCRIIVDF